MTRDRLVINEMLVEPIFFGAFRRPIPVSSHLSCLNSIKGEKHGKNRN